MEMLLLAINKLLMMKDKKVRELLYEDMELQ